jgi:hypothetical protein
VTEPQPVMEQAEQDQLTRQVGRALLTVAGEGWREVRAEYRSAGRHVEVDVFVTGPDGAPQLVRPPVEVVEGLGKLRQGMYRPGRGTWLSAMYLLEPPSSFSAEFEPDVEPHWRRVPPPIGFADELRFYPRAEEYIPDWLRQRAGLRSAGEPTPPGGTPGVGQPGAVASQPPMPPAPGQPVPGQPAPGQPLPAAGGPGGQGTPPGGMPQPERPVPAQGQPGGIPGGPQPGGPQHGFPPPGPPQGPPPPYQPGPPHPGGGQHPFQLPGDTGFAPGGPPGQPAW